MGETKTQTWQVVFNLESNTHRELMEWVMDQTKNRSSFIRETLLLRKMGAFNRSVGTVELDSQVEFDQNEILNLIQV